MAMSFSPPNPVRTTYSQPKHGLNPPKAILSLRGTYSRGLKCQQCDSRFCGVVSCSSATNYVTLRAGTRRTAGKSLAVKRVSERRTGIIRCATIEEIEAQKSLIEKSVKEKMEKTIESVRSNFNSMRTARANPSILDRLEVEYYGTPVNVKSIAQISTPDASSILVQPYDKSSLKAIEKAIVTSDLGLTPNNDGEVLRLSLPPLTSERRKELLKIVSKQAEEGKVALRNIRREAIKAYEKLEKEKKLSEDNVKDLSSDLQKVTDDYIKKVEAAYKQKEKEMLTV
ncbi:ribosome-recycling factor, chloroplastic-like [Actinidia eriantha]|uniref:ribosome-recycling factor, chloroplastic-like n=1 Tax=Actinidia eriantha TaxID=165200 RepID=UPI0025837107|nr:ribosome-recycling factor, chloroplastic-like [Actinidia eriantha]